MASRREKTRAPDTQAGAEPERLEALRFAALRDAVSDAILVTDAHGVILDANAPAAALLGVPGPHALLGRPMVEAAALPLDPAWSSLGADHRAARAVPLRGADGRLWACDYLPLTDGDIHLGDVWRLADVTLDAAREQAHRDELERLRDQMTALEELKTQMIRVAAHDLRGPLGIISAYLSLITDDLGDSAEQFREYLDPMQRAIDRMQRITTDLLSLERLRQDRKQAWQSFGLRDLVARAALDARGQAVSARQHLHTQLPDEAVAIRGDPVQMYEVVSNLIDNAIKYTPPGGTITLRLEADRDSVRFDVEDTGFGVPEPYQPHLFQPFYRVRTDETRGIDGTGLGLYLVKHIVEQHGGAVRVTSVHGQGSTFGFTLPLAPPA